MQNVKQVLADMGALFALCLLVPEQNSDSGVEFTCPLGGREAIDHQLDILIGLYLHGACDDLGYRVSGVILLEGGSWEYGPVVDEGVLSDMLPKESDLELTT